MTLADKIRAFDRDVPLERASTIPACWYRDADVQEAERQAVFGRTWLAAGSACLVEKPESFLTAEIAGEPILVVRDQEGTLRAFHNVCRHRAAPLRTEPCGHVTKLRCRYHGWTYDLAGQLRGVPEFDGVADFRTEGNGLVSLAVDSWGPFVWIHALPVSVPLREFLDPLPRLLAGMGMDQLIFAERRTYELRCNWKVFVDNYLDGGYHVHTIHPGLAGVLDYAAYRTEVAAFISTQISPLKPASSQESQAVEQVRGGTNACYAYVFPNLMLNVYQGYADTNRVLPLGADRCQVVFDFFFDRIEGEEQQARIKQSIEVSHQIQLEDLGICEEVQRGLGSRAFQTGRYSVRREAAVHAFHRLLARHLHALLSESGDWGQ
jgi:choline monooxygenase